MDCVPVYVAALCVLAALAHLPWGRGVCSRLKRDVRSERGLTRRLLRLRKGESKAIEVAGRKVTAWA